MDDRIRQLENKVTLSGILAELDEKREGVTANGSIPYISFSGAVQCGDSASQTVRFRTFVKSKKNDGSESKLYKKVKDWYNSAVPLTRATTSNPVTMVELVGSVGDNPFVTASGDHVEATQYNVNFFNEFKSYKAEIVLEGFIHSIIPEVRKSGEDEVETGRQKMRLITRDNFGNTLDIKNIIIPQNLVEDVSDAGWERGATTVVNIDITPNTMAAPKKAGAFGKQHVTEGKQYLELLVVGGEAALKDDDERALDPKKIKELMAIRTSKLNEIWAKGYQGNNSTQANRIGIAKHDNMEVSKAMDITIEEDFPF